MKNEKKKALVFYQYLPPWRIDVFNEMGKYYDLTIVFTNADCEGFTYNRQELLDRLEGIETLFLNTGFKIGSRSVRLGIFNLLKKYKPDVVFSHEYSPTSIFIALYKWLGLCKYHYYLTTSDNLKMAESSAGLKARARTFVLNRADGIIVYSRSVKDWYAKHFPKLRIAICPNIQNPSSLLAYRARFGEINEEYKSRFHLEGDRLILFTGRLVRVKGLDLLLNAFAGLKNEGYKLVIVGEGEDKAVLQQMAVDLGIADKVLFAGFYDGPGLYAWYDLADFFILPSRYEPFGAVVNEALVYGCPVVVSKYIGAVDFVDETNGMMFDPLDETEFVGVLRSAMHKYTARTAKRENLMLCSFDDYVKSFYTINY